LINNILEFNIRTGKIRIHYNQCEPAVKDTSTPSCGFACVKADRLYGRNVLRIEQNRPVLAVPASEVERLCNECLGCEHDCTFFGKNCIQIELPLFGQET
jgi:hypothetical protein